MKVPHWSKHAPIKRNAPPNSSHVHSACVQSGMLTCRRHSVVGSEQSWKRVGNRKPDTRSPSSFCTQRPSVRIQIKEIGFTAAESKEYHGVRSILLETWQRRWINSSIANVDNICLVHRNRKILSPAATHRRSGGQYGHDGTYSDDPSGKHCSMYLSRLSKNKRKFWLKHCNFWRGGSPTHSGNTSELKESSTSGVGCALVDTALTPRNRSNSTHTTEE